MGRMSAEWEWSGSIWFGWLGWIGFLRWVKGEVVIIGFGVVETILVLMGWFLGQGGEVRFEVESFSFLLDMV